MPRSTLRGGVQRKSSSGSSDRGRAVLGSTLLNWWWGDEGKSHLGGKNNTEEKTFPDKSGMRKSMPRILGGNREETKGIGKRFSCTPDSSRRMVRGRVGRKDQYSTEVASALKTRNSPLREDGERKQLARFLKNF